MKHAVLLAVVYVFALGVTGAAVWLGMWYPRLRAAVLFLGLPLLLALLVYGLLRQRQADQERQLLRERINRNQNKEK